VVRLVESIFEEELHGSSSSCKPE